ncbi:hypothetical protein HNR40_006982 [Nonomuraea endophytica]|uniref:Uncharacterized protein n=1 Tax=Nonomuraea endophytica TaxID=714136 RepID=A0A7W8A8C6_9ACTN|nr:hypothetical protein [Nonomuraea endophytica]
MQQEAGPAEGERSDDGVVQAVGPAGIGGVPEHVRRLMVQAVLLIHRQRRDGAQRDGHALGRSGRAGGEQLDQGRIASGGDIAFQWRVAGDQLGEGQILADGRPGADDLPRGVRGKVGGRVEFGALVGVGDHHLGGVAGDPDRDRRRCERGEQGHVDRAQPPDGQQGDDQFGGLAHQRGDPVSPAHAQLRQGAGQAGRGLAQFAERQIPAGQVRLDDGERHGVGRVPVTQQLRRAGPRRAEAREQLLHALFRAGHRTP